MSGDEIELDVSNLEPPEPFFAALDALDVLEPGQQLRLVLRREPLPLYVKLRELGFDFRTEYFPPARWHVLIRHAGEPIVSIAGHASSGQPRRS